MRASIFVAAFVATAAATPIPVAQGQLGNPLDQLKQSAKGISGSITGNLDRNRGNGNGNSAGNGSGSGNNFGNGNGANGSGNGNGLNGNSGNGNGNSILSPSLGDITN